MAGKLLITRSEFAKTAGVDTAAVVSACKRSLRAASVGELINVAHPDAQAYIKKHTKPVAGEKADCDPLLTAIRDYCHREQHLSPKRISERFRIGVSRARKIIDQLRIEGDLPEYDTRTVRQGPAPKVSVADDDSDVEFEIPEDVMEYAEMPFSRVVRMFRTDSRFKGHLMALQKIHAINEKEIKNAKLAGELVSRVLVKEHVIDKFNEAHLRLADDGVTTLVAGIISKHESGAEVAAIEEYATEIIFSFVAPAKRAIAEALGE